MNEIEHVWWGSVCGEVLCIIVVTVTWVPQWLIDRHEWSLLTTQVVHLRTPPLYYPPPLRPCPYYWYLVAEAVRLASGQYAFYWNALLFCIIILIVHFQFRVPTFPDWQNSLTFPVLFAIFPVFFLNVLFPKLKTWSILANNTQFI